MNLESGPIVMNVCSFNGIIIMAFAFFSNMALWAVYDLFQGRKCTQNENRIYHFSHTFHAYSTVNYAYAIMCMSFYMDANEIRRSLIIKVLNTLRGFIFVIRK
ncbi:hypothetical protein ACJX0J_031522 [Zea mays]